MSMYRSLYHRVSHLLSNPIVTAIRGAPGANINGQLSALTAQTPTRLLSSTSRYLDTMAPDSQSKSSTIPASSSADTSDQEQRQPEQTSQPLHLPPPPTAEDGARQLDVSGSGSTIKLDHLGPLVVNQDGTLSRIANWETMTEIERRNTLRVLGKRNKLRMDVLKAGEIAGEGDKGEK